MSGANLGLTLPEDKIIRVPLYPQCRGSNTLQIPGLHCEGLYQPLPFLRTRPSYFSFKVQFKPRPLLYEDHELSSTLIRPFHSHRPIAQRPTFLRIKNITIKPNFT